MRAVLRRNDPRPLGDDLPRRAHQLVGPGDGDRHPVDNFTQCDRIQVGFGSMPKVETRVERAVAHADQRLAGQHLMQLELELGMALEGESEQFAHLQDGWVQNRADLDGAGGQAAKPLRGVSELLYCLDDALRVLKQAPARGGERHSRRGALEQRHAQVFFERLDLPRQRGLAQMQGLGGAREMAELGDGDERLKVIELHISGTRRPDALPCPH